MIVRSLSLILIASAAVAQDYYYVHTNKLLNLPAEIYSIDLRDRDDRREYTRTGLLMPGGLPALVDAQSGDMVCQPTSTIQQAIAQLRATQIQAVVNETPKFFDAFTLSTNTISLIGTNRTGFALLRYDGTKLTAAQREQYQTECIQYLAARLQLLERELRRRKLVNIKPLAEKDAP